MDVNAEGMRRFLAPRSRIALGHVAWGARPAICQPKYDALDTRDVCSGSAPLRTERQGKHLDTALRRAAGLT